MIEITLSEEEHKKMSRLHDRIKSHPIREGHYKPKMNDYTSYAKMLKELMDLYYNSVKDHLDTALERGEITEEQHKILRMKNGGIRHNVWGLFNGISYRSTIASREKFLYRMSFCDVMLGMYHAYIENPQINKLKNIYGYGEPSRGQEPYYIVRFEYNEELNKYEIDLRDLPKYIEVIQRLYDRRKEFTDKRIAEGKEKAGEDRTLVYWKKELDEGKRRLGQ